MTQEQFENWLETKPTPKEVFETFWEGKEEELEEIIKGEI